MANIQIPDSYLDYILREKKAAMRLADYKETGIWNEDSSYDDVYLTEDEIIMFEDIFRSKFFPKKNSLRTNLVEGERYENEFNAIQNFAAQFSSIAERFDIEITDQQIAYQEGDFDVQTIDISQDAFFQNYLSQLSLDTYDIDIIIVSRNNGPYISLSTSNGQYYVDPVNDYILMPAVG